MAAMNAMLRFLSRDTHFLPGLAMLGFGAWLAWQGLGMPRPTGWRSGPGLFPLLIGLSLCLMALGLILEGWLKRKNTREHPAPEAAPAGGEASADVWRRAWRTLAIMGLVLGYVYLLLEYVPFEIATALFLLVSFKIFWGKSWWLMASVSVLATVVISMMFFILFETLLPGRTSLLEAYYY